MFAAGEFLEPRLNRADLEAHASWRRAAEAHSKCRAYARALDRAGVVLDEASRLASKPSLMWSGGKDSTVLAHLARDRGMPVVVQKDDLDYPGETEYVTTAAEAWGLDLRIVRPEMSARAWLDAHASSMAREDDIHSRSSELSKHVFYGVVERATGTGPIILGLRAQESRGRAMNYATRGVVYTKASGQTVCCPLALWSGLDVLAYAEVNGIELLPVYSCIGLLDEHRHEPWRIRKSWFLPGKEGHRWAWWLSHYWPSLYREWVRWFPGAKMW